MRAVVGVDTRAARESRVVFAKPVVVPDEVKVWLGPPQDLSAQSRLAVVTRIRLPAVNDPRFDLQLGCREILDAKAVEKPRRVRGYEGRLISPIVKIVVAKQADIGNKNSGVYVQPMSYIPVISTPAL